MQKRLVPTLLLIAYTALLINVIVFKNVNITTPWMMIRLGGEPIGPGNFVPFKTIVPHLQGKPNRFFATIDLLVNTVAFMPMGALVPLVCERMHWRRMTWPTAILLALGVGLTMEGMQLLFRVGIVDVDDIILNALGVVIGYGLWTIQEKRRRHQLKPV